MKPEIQLQSRGNIDNRLVHVEGNKYKLKTDFNYRTGFDPGDIDIPTFIDPAGGPFMAVGSEIDGRIIKALHNGGIIEFEDE